MTKTPCPLPTAISLSDLRDQLSLFAAHEAREAREYYLQRLANLFEAHSAAWVISVLKNNGTEEDPSLDWSPRVLTKLRADGSFTATLRATNKPLADKELGVTTMGRLADAGSFHVYQLTDLADEASGVSSRHREFLLEMGLSDSMCGLVPLGTDIYVHVRVDREAKQPIFTQEEAAAYASALQGLKWFFKQQVLGEGIFSAHTYLTNAEREVLLCLLKGDSKYLIAHNLSKSTHTIDAAVKSIFKKCGVDSRPALTALWLGKGVRTVS